MPYHGLGPILGGSGHVGRTITEVISQDPRHSIIMLGRRVVNLTLPSPRSFTNKAFDIDPTRDFS